MHYVRMFGGITRASQWQELTPDAPGLLKCFDVPDVKAKRISPVSVFSASSPADELQNAAAFFSTSPKKAEKRFAVRVTGEDCRQAGLKFDRSSGETGVSVVDARHADLTGTAEQFQVLIRRLVGKMWEGEERIRAFSAHTILGEIAVLSNSGLTDEYALVRCKEVLELSSDLHTLDSNSVRLEGQLKGANPAADVVGVRQLGSSKRNRWSAILAWFGIEN